MSILRKFCGTGGRGRILPALACALGVAGLAFAAVPRESFSVDVREGSDTAVEGTEAGSLSVADQETVDGPAEDAAQPDGGAAVSDAAGDGEDISGNRSLMGEGEEPEELEAGGRNAAAKDPAPGDEGISPQASSGNVRWTHNGKTEMVLLEAAMAGFRSEGGTHVIDFLSDITVGSGVNLTVNAGDKPSSLTWNLNGYTVDVGGNVIYVNLTEKTSTFTINGGSRRASVSSSSVNAPGSAVIDRNARTGVYYGTDGESWTKYSASFAGMGCLKVSSEMPGADTEGLITHQRGSAVVNDVLFLSDEDVSLDKHYIGYVCSAGGDGQGVFSGCTFLGFQAHGVRTGGGTHLKGCHILGCSSTWAGSGGGAWFGWNSDRLNIMEDTVVAGCSSLRSGGGISVTDAKGSLSLRGNNLITGNSTSVNGGGMQLGSESGLMELTSGTTVVCNNQAWNEEKKTGDGGGIEMCQGVFVQKQGSKLLVHGNKAAVGAGILAGGYQYMADFTLRNAVISGNEAVSSGGGLWIRALRFSISGTDICDNTAGDAGGGLGFSDVGALSKGKERLWDIRDTMIRNNSAKRGGGMSVPRFNYKDWEKDSHPDGEIPLFDAVKWNVSISGNDAVTGGGVYVDSGSRSEWKRADISNNRTRTGNRGAGVYADKNAELTFWYCDIHENVVEKPSDEDVFLSQGAGIFGMDKTDIKVYTDCKVRDNVVKGLGKGAGIAMAEDSSLDIQSASVSGNSITGKADEESEGAGIYIAKRGYLHAWNSEISGNTGGAYVYGGGVYLNQGSKVEMFTVKVSGNTLGRLGRGAGIYANGSEEMTLYPVEVSSNEAMSSGSYGGGIYLESVAKCVIGRESSISANQAYNDGGGLYVSGDTKLTVRDSSIRGNIAKWRHGGGMYLNGNYEITRKDETVPAKRVMVSCLNMEISDNTTRSHGGGVCLADNAELHLGQKGDDTLACSVSGNSAGEGGGIYLSDRDDLRLLSGTSVTGNSASSHGGIRWEKGKIVLVPDPDWVGDIGHENQRPMIETVEGSLKLYGDITIKDNQAENAHPNLYLESNRYLESMGSSGHGPSGEEWYDDGLVSGMVHVEADTDREDSDVVVCRYPAFTDVAFGRHMDLFVSDNEDMVPVASSRNPYDVVLIDKFDHSNHTGVDFIGTHTSMKEKAGLVSLLSAAADKAEAGECRHGFQTVFRCGICSGHLTNFTGDYAGAQWQDSDAEDNLVMRSIGLLFSWDDGITVDTESGMADLLEGIFDSGVSVSPYMVFDENLEPVEVSGGRYAGLEEGRDYLVDYLVSGPDGSTGFISRPVHVYSSLAWGDMGDFGKAEAAFFLRDNDYYGTFGECISLLSKYGGTVSLLKDVSADGFSISGKASCPVSGFYLNGHDVAFSGPVKAAEGRAFCIVDAPWAAEDKSEVSGDSDPSLSGGILSYTLADADGEGYVYTKVDADLSHAGELVFTGVSGYAIEAAGPFALSGARVSTGSASGLSWNVARNKGDLGSVLFSGSGERAVSLEHMNQELSMESVYALGYGQGFVLSSDIRAYPRVSGKNLVALSCKGAGFTLTGDGAGTFDAVSCVSIHNGRGVDLSFNREWAPSFDGWHISHNVSSGDGAGILLKGSLSLNGCSILFNTSGGSGGAIRLSNGARLSAPLSGRKPTDICGNLAAADGGGICFSPDGYAVTDAEADFAVGHAYGNRCSGKGGFGYFETDPQLTPVVFLDALHVTRNTAGTGGGGLWLDGAQVRLPDTFTVVDNLLTDPPENTPEEDVHLSAEYLLRIPNTIQEGSRMGVSLPKRPSSLREVGLASTLDESPVLDFADAFILQGRASGKMYVVEIGSVASSLVVRIKGTSGSSMDSALVYVQFVAPQDVLPDEKPAGTKSELTVIDTSNTGDTETSGGMGLLPKNTGKGTYVSPNDNGFKSIYLDPDGNVLRETRMLPIYSPYYYNLKEGDRAWWFDRFSNYGYQSSEIWVQPAGGNPDSNDPADWPVKVPYSDDVQFSLSDTEGCVQFGEGYTIRIVAEALEGTRLQDSVFYDYDISDGMVYANANDAKAQTNGVPSGSSSWKYVYTVNQGINSLENYDPAPERDVRLQFAFGNANAGTGIGQLLWRNPSDLASPNRVNAANKGWNGAKVPSTNHYGSTLGCSFGTVIGISGGCPVFHDGITAPDLFGDGEVKGRTESDVGKSLEFSTQGYINVLTAVPGTVTKGLDSFRNPGIYDGTNGNSLIWSNDFWPMDSSFTWGTAGHDVCFGSKARNCQFNGIQPNGSGEQTGSLPYSDDDLDHNSYFGMHTAFDFQMPRGYCGPLEFLFYGDDDLWVFLDGKLVCDIGGVHSSVGEYVDFWDWIPKNDVRKHHVEIFYMERGASGSSCWMQYTLPGVTRENEVPEKNIRITKSLGNEMPEGTEVSEDGYRFRLLAGATKGSIVPYIGEYRVNDQWFDTEDGVLGPIQAGQSLVVPGIPEGTLFTVEEWWGDGESRPIEFDQPIVGILDGSALPGDGYTGEVSGTDVDVLVEVMNFFTQRWDFAIRKADADTGRYLPGAGFSLTPVDDGGNPSGEALPGVTDKNGKVSWNILGLGRWLLTEDVPPEGYQEAGPWILVSNQAGDVTLYEAVEAEGGGYTPGAMKTLTQPGENMYQFLCLDEPEEGYSGPILPETGGMGIFWIELAGTAFLMAATLRAVFWRVAGK